MKIDLNLVKEKLKKAISKEIFSLFFADKKRLTKFAVICISTLLLVSSLIFGVVYVNDYYRADKEAIETFSSAYDNITVDECDDFITTKPENAKIGFIFYPGGKVEYSSYLPLMLSLSERGILCVLTSMPLNLAVLDVNAADGISEKYSEIESWYIGGHSLGGSMAASYLANNTDKIDGLILLGSYSTEDVSEKPTLSIYGSEDGVMNREKYEKYKTNLPKDLTEIVIEGGNHAYFGMYGEQKGDGKAYITPTEQTTKTADIIAEFILGQER